MPEGTPDLGARSMFEYGSRVGFWRLWLQFEGRDMAVTVFGCAQALEHSLEAAAAIRESDHDVCGHGWRWVEHFRLGEDEERDHIARAVASLKKTVGERPLGWYCRYAPSVNTRRLLVEEGGFLYDSDAYNDELAYWTEVEGTPQLIVPYSLTKNDTQFKRGNMTQGNDFFGLIKGAVDMLRDEGAEIPKMMSVGLHCRLIGHPIVHPATPTNGYLKRKPSRIWNCSPPRSFPTSRSGHGRTRRRTKRSERSGHRRR